MTNYNPYKGLKPERAGKLSSRGRTGWGIVAATAVGALFYRNWNTGNAEVPKSKLEKIEFTQSAATTINVGSVDVSYGGLYSPNFSLDGDGPLHISATFVRKERGHVVNVIPIIDGVELSNSKVSNSNAQGIASVDFPRADVQSIIGTGNNVTSIRFKFIADGDHTTPVIVECPIAV